MISGLPCNSQMSWVRGGPSATGWHVRMLRNTKAVLGRLNPKRTLRVASNSTPCQ
jgi:hypothetical protein